MAGYPAHHTGRVIKQVARPAGVITPGGGGPGQPDYIRLEASLVDARLSYESGDRAHGRRALEQALKLGHPEQIRLPFVMERTWIRPVLRLDPDLIHAYRRLLEPDLVSTDRVPARRLRAMGRP